MCSERRISVQVTVYYITFHHKPDRHKTSDCFKHTKLQGKQINNKWILLTLRLRDLTNSSWHPILALNQKPKNVFHCILYIKQEPPNWNQHHDVLILFHFPQNWEMNVMLRVKETGSLFRYLKTPLFKFNMDDWLGSRDLIFL